MAKDSKLIKKESKRIINIEQYFAAFPNRVREEAIKHILDIRKFEIDLYWKRAAYFWSFIGATLIGYLALINASNPTPIQKLSQFIIIVLGVMFSLCWYFGSKFWQLNWEKHLDIMEDNLIGPLYKTTINRDYYMKRWWVINGPYPFSVSKINIILSFFIFIIWVLIYIYFLYTNCSFSIDNAFNFYTALNVLLWIGVTVLILFGRTGKPFKDEFITHINFVIRGFSEEPANNQTTDQCE